MQAKPNDQETVDQQHAARTEVPPKEDPKKVAGSLDPKQKAPFYEAVAQKAKRRRR